MTPTFVFVFLPEIFLVLGLCFLLVYGLVLSRENMKVSAFCYCMVFHLVLVLLGTLFALLTSEAWWYWYSLSDYANFYGDESFFFSTKIACFSKVVLISLTSCCVLLHWPSFSTRRAVMEYCFFIIFITLASFLLMSARDFGVTYLGLEIQTLALLAFVNIGRRSGVTVESGLRYFINTAFASVALLFGLSILYLMAGTLDSFGLVKLLSLFPQEPVLYNTVIGSLVLVFFAIFFKLTLVPFHYWVGDLYEGMPGYVGSYFTVVTKLPIWVFFTKVLFVLGPHIGPFLYIFQFLGLVSLFVGNVSALTEYQFRRFWALSSIGHMGQITLALLLCSGESEMIATLYLFLYLTSNIFFWGLLLSIIKKFPNLNLTYSEFFTSVFRVFSLEGDKSLSIMFFFLLISLAGLPPAFGSIAKIYLFITLYSSHSFGLFALVFACNIISIVYYIRLVRFLFFKENFPKSLNENSMKLSKLPTLIVYVLVLVFLLHSFFGFSLLYLVLSSLIGL